MPRPEYRNGPWGEGIRYWLSKRGVLQAELAREANVNANTMSRATRGLHVNTSSLERIANALRAPIEDVLVSPDRQSAREAKEQQALEITRRVLKELEQGGSLAPLDVTTATPPPPSALAPFEKAAEHIVSKAKRPRGKRGKRR